LLSAAVATYRVRREAVTMLRKQAADDGGTDALVVDGAGQRVGFGWREYVEQYSSAALDARLWLGCGEGVN
jgi:hypothetical protein